MSRKGQDSRYPVRDRRSPERYGHTVSSQTEISDEENTDLDTLRNTTPDFDISDTDKTEHSHKFTDENTLKEDTDTVPGVTDKTLASSDSVQSNTNIMSNQPGVSAVGTTWIKQAATNLTKFDGQEQSLDSWFKYAETVAWDPATDKVNDKIAIDAALAHIDYDIADNSAIFIAGDPATVACTNWEDFKKIFRTGVCERQLSDVFTLLGLWSEMRLGSSEKPTTWLHKMNQSTELFVKTLLNANFNDLPNQTFSARAVGELIKTSFILRELPIGTRQRLLNRQLSPATTTVQLKSYIVADGGWGSRSAVRGVQHSTSNAPLKGKDVLAVSKTTGKKGKSVKTIDQMICYTCGLTGHKGIDCPNAGVLQQYQSQKSPSASPSSVPSDKSSEVVNNAKKKYCPLHKSRKHDESECTVLAKKRQETVKALAQCAPPGITKS